MGRIGAPVLMMDEWISSRSVGAQVVTETHLSQNPRVKQPERRLLSNEAHNAWIWFIETNRWRQSRSEGQGQTPVDPPRQSESQ